MSRYAGVDMHVPRGVLSLPPLPTVQTVPCGGLNDTACAPLSTCFPGAQYESIAPSATSDRECVYATTCDGGAQFESRALSAQQDRLCNDTTTCSATQFISTANTATCASCVCVCVCVSCV